MEEEVGVPAGVLDEVVAAHEALVAEWAQEAFLAGVGAQVTGQLVGTGELLRSRARSKERASHLDRAHGRSTTH